MKTATGFVIAMVVLAACTTSDNPEAALGVAAEGAASQRPSAAVGPGSADANEGIPRATAAGTSPIKPEIQAAFCQDQVAFMQSVEPQFATAQPPVIAADGSTTITVTIVKENEGARTFDCRLDAGNRFVGVSTAAIRDAL